MIANNLISSETPYAKETDKAEMVLELMDEFLMDEIAIVDEKNNYLGLLTNEQISELKEGDYAFSSVKNSMHKPHVLAESHFIDALSAFFSFKCSILPVTDENMNYIGTISSKTFIQQIGAYIGASEIGSILILELVQRDYSLAEISRIVEGNDTKILSSFLSSSPSSKIDQFLVTLKLNRKDIDGVIQSFKRYNYNIFASFHKSEYEDDLKDRFENFMKYLNP